MTEIVFYVDAYFVACYRVLNMVLEEFPVPVIAQREAEPLMAFSSKGDVTTS